MSSENNARDFIRTIIDEDLSSGKHSAIQTRFPPEPNGYLHIGHAKAICLNFGLPTEYPGQCNLRFDDTNPLKEETEYVEAIEQDIRWLGFDFEDRCFFASNYFERLYELAEVLIRKGKAYVDSLSAEETRAYRGTPTEPGRDSPYRDRSVDENLDLFRRMRAGEFEEGAHVLRAKIDMASGNLNLRDPTLYRIRHVTHHRTGDAWHIYPMYDFTHPLSDALEGVTHSLCTLEFESHRPLYDWVVAETEIEHVPRQIEFARLELAYTLVSKRYLRKLVEAGVVDGWDDPRMPTIRALRRRGITPRAVRNFCDSIGLAKRNSRVDLAQLEHAMRQDLNAVAPRRMAVLDPLKLTITNWPEGKVDWVDAINNPEDESAGSRQLPFSGEILIERADFMEDPPKKFFRLGPGREVRLRYGYYVTCDEVVKDDAGNVVELRCTYDPESRGGNTPDGRRVKGTLHWVSAPHAVEAEIRLYDRLFLRENMRRLPDGKEATDYLNPDSLIVQTGAQLEPSLGESKHDVTYQFERMGYFCLDLNEGRAPDRLVFNRTATLRDTWAKVAKKG